MPSIILAAHGRITSRHGQDVGRGFPHRGIDQGHNDGTAYDLEIRAPADGIVTFAGEFGSYGLVLFITHRDGWVSVLAHHAKHFVRKGSWVKRGQIIAVMGNTGTKYVHSHQELRDNTSRQLDPLKHVAAPAAASAPVAVAVPIPPAPSLQGDSPVFIATHQGSHYLIVPQGDKNAAIALGRQDTKAGFARVDFVWENSWEAFKKTLVNPPA